MIAAVTVAQLRSPYLSVYQLLRKRVATMNKVSRTILVANNFDDMSCTRDKCFWLG